MIFNFIINRWICERPEQSKCCPTCKKTACLEDLRQLYAHRIVVADASTEHCLQEKLEIEIKKNIDLQIKLSSKCSESTVIQENGKNLGSITKELMEVWHIPNTNILNNRTVIKSKEQMKNIEIFLLNMRKIEMDCEIQKHKIQTEFEIKKYEIHAEHRIQKYKIEQEYKLKMQQLNLTRQSNR